MAFIQEIPFLIIPIELCVVWKRDTCNKIYILLSNIDMNTEKFNWKLISLSEAFFRVIWLSERLFGGVLIKLFFGSMHNLKHFYERHTDICINFWRGDSKNSGNWRKISYFWKGFESFPRTWNFHSTIELSKFISLRIFSIFFPCESIFITKLQLRKSEWKSYFRL